MRLLFNQNLSVRLVRSLSDVYPGSSHVSLVGLEAAPIGWLFRTWQCPERLNSLATTL